MIFITAVLAHLSIARCIARYRCPTRLSLHESVRAISTESRRKLKNLQSESTSEVAMTGPRG